ncbi:MAG: histidine phosphatase family protein [Candidatus Micrarchaeota archaeon]
MKFFLIRHAETTANTKAVILGRKDGGELSARGKRQAMGVARRLAKEKISEVYCSSANRARETARIIMGKRDCKTFYCDELQEIDMGELEGLTHEEAETRCPRIFGEITADTDKRIPGGESILDVQKRVMPLIENLAKKEGDQTVVVVGHSIVNRVILNSLLELPLGSKALKQKNVAISMLDVKPGFSQLYTLDNSLHSIK